MQFIWVLLLGLVSGALGAEKPNVLFIFADDLAYESVGFMGNDEVKTPNLDKLAARGVIFNNAFNSGAWNGAICVASRAMLFTGKQVWNAQAADLKGMAKGEEFWPQVMAKGGYETYFAGKWHTGTKKLASDIFENTSHVRPGMPHPKDKSQYKRPFVKGEKDWSPFDQTQGGYWLGGKHWSEVLADDAGVFFEKVKGSEKPFFMSLCFNAPHDPRQAPERYQKMYPYDGVSVPKDFVATYPYNIGSNTVRDEQLAPFPRTPYSVQVNRSEYYAMITHMDEQIGKILAMLEKSGKAENTYIIFTADHGLACGHHGLLGKQNSYDHSVRVPWVIVGPKVPAGKKVDEMIYLQDAMATALDVAGVDKPNYVEFESVLPLIAGEGKGRDVVYNSYMYFQRMARDERYKLIAYPVIKKELLYDLKNDPMEMVDLSEDPKYAKELERMRGLLDVEMKRMNDPMDLKDPKSSYQAGIKR